jgi:hypothetical protein
VEQLAPNLRFILRRKGGSQMFRQPPSTYLTADELEQIRAIKFNETEPKPSPLLYLKTEESFT